MHVSRSLFVYSRTCFDQMEMHLFHHFGKCVGEGLCICNRTLGILNVIIDISDHRVMIIFVWLLMTFLLLTKLASIPYQFTTFTFSTAKSQSSKKHVHLFCWTILLYGHPSLAAGWFFLQSPQIPCLALLLFLPMCQNTQLEYRLHKNQHFLVRPSSQSPNHTY